MAVVKGILSIKLETTAETHNISSIATNIRLFESTAITVSLTCANIQSIRPSSFKAYKTKLDVYNSATLFKSKTAIICQPKTPFRTKERGLIRTRQHSYDPL